MADQRDIALREYITSVKQRPQFDQQGDSTQVVTVAFRTPHGFTGTVTMPLSDWIDRDTRTDKVFQAIVDLEGPFWEESEGAEESE